MKVAVRFAALAVIGLSLAGCGSGGNKLAMSPEERTAALEAKITALENQVATSTSTTTTSTSTTSTSTTTTTVSRPSMTTTSRPLASIAAIKTPTTVGPTCSVSMPTTVPMGQRVSAIVRTNLPNSWIEVMTNGGGGGSWSDASGTVVRSLGTGRRGEYVVTVATRGTPPDSPKIQLPCSLTYWVV